MLLALLLVVALLVEAFSATSPRRPKAGNAGALLTVMALL